MFSSRLKFLCGMITACLLAFSPAIGEAQKDLKKEIQKLKKRVGELEGQVTAIDGRVTGLETENAVLGDRVADIENSWNHHTIEVVCSPSDPNALSDAIAEAESRPGPVAIRISGFCEEDVWIHRDDILVEGVNEGYGVRFLGLDGSRRVYLNQLTLGGSEAINGASFSAYLLDISLTGLYVHMGASGVISDSTINSISTSVSLQVKENASLTLLSSVIEHDNSIGSVAVSAGSGGSLVLQTCEVRGAWWGANVGENGVIKLIDGTIVENSVESCVHVSNGVAKISGTIRNCLGDGIFVERGEVEVEGHVVDNAWSGLQVLGGGSAYIGKDAVVEGNGVGVSLYAYGSAFIEGTIKNNLGDGVLLWGAGRVHVGTIGGPAVPAEIIDNTGFGINCDDAGGGQIFLGWDSTVSGNNNPQINNCANVYSKNPNLP